MEGCSARCQREEKHGPDAIYGIMIESQSARVFIHVDSQERHKSSSGDLLQPSLVLAVLRGNHGLNSRDWKAAFGVIPCKMIW